MFFLNFPRPTLSNGTPPSTPIERLAALVPSAESVKGLGTRVAEAVSTESARGLKAAVRGGRQAARAGRAFAKEHPAATAGALVGLGAVAGAVLHRALQPEPTLREVLGRTLSRKATRASASLAKAAGRQAAALRKKLR